MKILSHPLPNMASTAVNKNEHPSMRNILSGVKEPLIYKTTNKIKNVIRKKDKLPSKDFVPVIWYLFLPYFLPMRPAKPSDTPSTRAAP